MLVLVQCWSGWERQWVNSWASLCSSPLLVLVLVLSETFTGWVSGDVQSLNVSVLRGRSLLYFWTHESSSLLLHNTNFVHWDSTAAEIDAAAQVLVRIPQWRFNWAWLSAGYSSKSSRVLLLNTSTWVCAASYLKVNIVILLHYHLTAASLCRCGF